MKTLQVRNAACALVGLAALALCILACTSFSPDDRKILYPTFDPQSGALSISVYDRPSKTSRQVFVLRGKATKDDNSPLPPRAQWLPDGKRVVVTWTLEVDSKEEKSIACFAVVTLDNSEPVRVLHLKGLAECACLDRRPLPMIGNRVFTVGGFESCQPRPDLRRSDLSTASRGNRTIHVASNQSPRVWERSGRWPL